MKSELNPDNERKLGEVNSKVSEDLEPLNESLNLVNKILDYLRKAEQRHRKQKNKNNPNHNHSSLDLKIITNRASDFTFASAQKISN